MLWVRVAGADDWTAPCLTRTGAGRLRLAGSSAQLRCSSSVQITFVRLINSTTVKFNAELLANEVAIAFTRTYNAINAEMDGRWREQIR